MGLVIEESPENVVELNPTTADIDDQAADGVS